MELDIALLQPLETSRSCSGLMAGLYNLDFWALRLILIVQCLPYESLEVLMLAGKYRDRPTALQLQLLYGCLDITQPRLRPLRHYPANLCP